MLNTSDVLQCCRESVMCKQKKASIPILITAQFHNWPQNLFMNKRARYSVGMCGLQQLL